MTRQRQAQLATAGVLVVLAGVVGLRQAGWKLPGRAARSTTPQDAVYAMLDAARQGDVTAYLAHFSPVLQVSLRQAISESTEKGFARYLRDSNAPIRGIAITEPEKLSETEVKVRVEYVYQDRNEVQFMYLSKRAESWMITRLDAAERVKTLIPYGTPVE